MFDTLTASDTHNDVRSDAGLRRTILATDRSSIILILTVLLFATVPVIPNLFDDLFTPDESMLLVYPERILSGQWPNRDFFNFAYGPGQFWLLAGVYRIFGASIVAERLVGWLLHLAIVFGVVRIARPRGRFVAGMAGGASAFMLAFLGLSAFAWLSALSLAIWSIGVLVGKRTRGAFVVAGLMVGLVFAIRPDLGPAAIACQLPLLRRSQFKRLWLVGFGLGAVPMVIHLVVAGPEFVKNFLFVLRASRTGMLAPPNVPISLRLAALLLAASVLALAWTAVRERDPILVAVTLLSTLLLPQAFQRTDLTHIADVGSFIWPMWFAMVFSRSALARELVHRYGARWLRQCISVTAVILIGAILALIGSSWRATSWLKHLDKSVPINEVTALQETEALIAAINQRVRPGGRIFVGAGDMRVLNYSPMYLYFILPEYLPSGYYLELPGSFEDSGETLSKAIRGADALLLSDTPALQRSLYRSGWRGSSIANEAVAEYFCPVGRYGDVLLYVRCRF